MFNPNTDKYRPKETQTLDNFHTVKLSWVDVWLGPKCTSQAFPIRSDVAKEYVSNFASFWNLHEKQLLSGFKCKKRSCLLEIKKKI